MVHCTLLHFLILSRSFPVRNRSHVEKHCLLCQTASMHWCPLCSWWMRRIYFRKTGSWAKSVFRVASLVSNATHLLLQGFMLMLLLKSKCHISSNVSSYLLLLHTTSWHHCLTYVVWNVKVKWSDYVEILNLITQRLAWFNNHQTTHKAVWIKVWGVWGLGIVYSRLRWEYSFTVWK